MSERTYNSYGGADFHEYVKRCNIIESVTDTVFELYGLAVRPADPLDYIRTHMTETISEREELEALTAKHDSMAGRIREMEDENMKLARKIKMLRDYEGKPRE